MWPLHLRAGFVTAASQADCVADLGGVRAVIRLAGPTLVHFLQGLLTNDVQPLEGPSAPPIYSCILNAQGRYLHDLFLFRTADAEPTVLVDTDTSGKDDLLRLLKRYRLRQKIEIDDVTESYTVLARWRDDDRSGGGSGLVAGWHADPRLRELGHRRLLPRGDATSSAGTSSGAELVPWQRYRRWRVVHGVAEGDSEIPPGEAIALEYNVDGLRGISFTKGCYVGQELMARTHFKGVVRKRLMPFRVVAGPGDGSGGIAPDADVYETPECSGRAVGRIRVVDGAQGLALLRLQSALPAAAEQRPVHVTGGGALLPLRPAWWPPHWGREDEHSGS